MTFEERMDQLMVHLEDFNMMGDELRKYEMDVTLGIAASKPTIEGVRSLTQVMLDSISKNGSFFREQTEVIRKISPAAAKQLDNVLAAYEDLQTIINAEFQKVTEWENMQYIGEELIERLDDYVHELARRYDEMRKSMTLSYNCIVGTLHFIVSDGAKNTRKRAGRGRKRAR